MKPPKVPHGQKIKDWPIDIRLLLRLVMLVERRDARGKGSADVAKLAQEIGVSVDDISGAVTTLLRSGWVEIKPVSLSGFEFSVHDEVRKAMLKPAHTYQAHLKAKVERMARIAQHTPPVHLPPITGEMRRPHMADGLALADKLGRAEFAEKMANCVVRIGKQETAKVVDAAIATHSGEDSLLRHFLVLYEKRRDELIPRPCAK